jgi:hypothetical protein
MAVDFLFTDESSCKLLQCRPTKLPSLTRTDLTFFASSPLSSSYNRNNQNKFVQALSEMRTLHLKKRKKMLAIFSTSTHKLSIIQY